MRTPVILALCASLVGCEDEGGGAPPPPTAPAAKPAQPTGASPAKPGAAGATGLSQYLHVEDVVSNDERESIRVQFKERDFVEVATGDNRDPFRSFVIVKQSIAEVSNTVDPSLSYCANKKLVAPSYSVRDLRLTGIAYRGTKRFALMQDSGNLGHVIVRGDCVGRERARAKDIGAGYISFEIVPEVPLPGQDALRAEQLDVKLHQKELRIEDDTAPVQPPTNVVLPGAAPGGAPPPAAQDMTAPVPAPEQLPPGVVQPPN